MGLETRAITDRVTKQIVTILSKTCNNTHLNKFENYSYDGVTRILIFKLRFEKGIKII